MSSFKEKLQMFEKRYQEYQARFGDKKKGNTNNNKNKVIKVASNKTNNKPEEEQNFGSISAPPTTPEKQIISIIDLSKYEKLNTLEKLILLQKDLKIVSSIRHQFEENQNKLLEKLNKGCLNYYKNKMYMKKIFDYCCGEDANFFYEYNLLTEKKVKDQLKDAYSDIYEFMLMLRKDNFLMIKILENYKSNDLKDFDDLSDFLVSFCYEDVLNSSFAQEDLLIIIYLFIEKCIIKNMPENEDLKNYTNTNLYEEFFNQSFLSSIFKSLTRKPDIRNYLCSILSEEILNIENLRRTLSLKVKIINQYLTIGTEMNTKYEKGARKGTVALGTMPLSILNGESDNFINMVQNKEKKNRNTISMSAFLHKDDNLGMPKAYSAQITKKKRNYSNEKPIKEAIKEEDDDDKLCNDNDKPKEDVDDPIEEKMIDVDNQKEEKMVDVEGFEIINLDDVATQLVDYESEYDTKKEEKKEDKTEEIKDDEYDVDLYNYFQEKKITLEYLNNKLKEYEEYLNKKNENSKCKYEQNTINIMIDYIKKLINDINSKEGGEDIYQISDSFSKVKLDTQNFDKIIEIRKKNYEETEKVICNLLNIIKSNTNSLPFFIKCLSQCIDMLFDYKYQDNLSIYSRYIIKANFILGNIILPVFENPNFNGLITNEIISSSTKKNLKLISKIIKKALTGKLFLSSEAKGNYTVYNKIIIDIVPQIFDIVQNVEKMDEDFNFPNFLKRFIDTIKDIDNEERDISYQRLEDQNKTFYYESICFSYYTLTHILEAAQNYLNSLNQENILSDKLKDIQQLIAKNVQYKGLISKLKTNIALNKLQKDFIYFVRLNLEPSFNSKIKTLLRDNFVNSDLPDKDRMDEEEIIRFKKCIVEVLTYVNTIKKNFFQNFILGKIENCVHERDILKKLSQNRFNRLYQDLLNETNIAENQPDGIENINPQFKEEILPFIFLNIKEEMGLNSNDDYYQRLLYCCTYIQLHIDLLPPKYVEDNYKLLIMELIQDTAIIQSNINILKNVVLGQLNVKIKQGEKTNMIIGNTYQKIKKMEKLKCIEFLYDTLVIPTHFKIETGKDSNNETIIKSVKYDESGKENKSYLQNAIPDFRNYEGRIDSIIDLEEKAGMADALNEYFEKLKGKIRINNIVSKYTPDEVELICSELVNYLMISLYDKLYPKDKIKDDILFYKKCCRLDFIKPENLIKDKNIINENMIQASKTFINEVDNKFTPADKIKCMAKAFSIVQNSITFCSGKKDLGVDDTLKPLIYVILKAKPKRIFSNFNYAELFLDPDLSKKQYGILLAQICMIKKIIKDMKYTELIGVTEEQFGKDECDDINDENDNKGN